MPSAYSLISPSTVGKPCSSTLNQNFRSLWPSSWVVMYIFQIHRLSRRWWRKPKPFRISLSESTIIFCSTNFTPLLLTSIKILLVFNELEIIVDIIQTSFCYILNRWKTATLSLTTEYKLPLTLSVAYYCILYSLLMTRS